MERSLIFLILPRVESDVSRGVEELRGAVWESAELRGLVSNRECLNNNVICRQMSWPSVTVDDHDKYPLYQSAYQYATALIHYLPTIPTLFLESINIFAGRTDPKSVSNGVPSSEIRMFCKIEKSC